MNHDFDHPELLRAVVDSVPSMLAYWDVSQRCRFANQAYVRWFGADPDRLIGRHISELLGPLYELNLPYIEGALRGERQDFEREIPDPAGGPSRHSLATYIPDRVGDAVRGFFVIVTDVTHIKRADAALEQANAELRELEERFRLTIDNAPIGMALVALDGRFTRVNRVLCEIVGYSEQELTGLTFQAITHPDDLDTDLALAERLADGNIARYQLEKRYVRKDGTIVPVMLSGSVVRGEGGKPRYFIAQIEDITDRTQREREQRLLANLGDILNSAVDYDERVRRMIDVIGGELGEICRMCDLPMPEGCHQRVRAVLETGEPVHVEAPPRELVGSFAHDDEDRRALEAANVRSMLIVPLRARDTLLGALALMSTSAIHRPAELRLAEELARSAALSLDNARLYREATRATQARDDLLGIVAHDLRNPLYTIMLRTAALQKTGRDRRTLEAAAGIERSTRRMNRLIEDLLDVTRIEAGRLSVAPVPTGVDVLVSEVVASQRALAAAGAIELRSELAPGLAEVAADPDRVQQVLENLIGNAIKFTPAGGHIVVGAAPQDDEIVFRVSDTGTGIAAADLDHVFDRFWQVNRLDRKGAGLGLPIAKGIIDAHGGRMWAESTPGHGTTISFTLPLAARAAHAAHAAAT